jgi:hypothetical protein
VAVFWCCYNEVYMAMRARYELVEHYKHCTGQDNVLSVDRYCMPSKILSVDRQSSNSDVYHHITV